MPDEERETVGDRRGWHFERRVSLGEVFTAAGLMLTIYFAANSVIGEFRTANATMDKRVSILEEKAAMQKTIDAAQDALTRDGQQRIEQSLSELNRFLRERKPQ
jgi:uncharacterized coiled-coil protein SlyX